MLPNFEWDEAKNEENQAKHGVSFEEAQVAFKDPHRLIQEDTSHSTDAEERWFCVGDIGTGIVTVRFTYRDLTIRILGAGYWRKKRREYYQPKGEL